MVPDVQVNSVIYDLNIVNEPAGPFVGGIGMGPDDKSELYFI